MSNAAFEHTEGRESPAMGPGSAGSRGAGPIANGFHIVEPGDGMSSIADRSGFFWETLWNHAENAELKAKRENPELLLPGDRVFVPALRNKRENCETTRTHTFRRKGVPVRIVLRLTDDHGRAFADAPYTLKVGGLSYSGVTTGDGGIEHWVSPVARVADLALEPGRPGFPDTITWRIDIGRLGPSDTLAGVQARLNNLRFFCGRADGQLDGPTGDAIRAFQSAHGISITGEPDGATIAKLREVYGV